MASPEERIELNRLLDQMLGMGITSNRSMTYPEHRWKNPDYLDALDARDNPAYLSSLEAAGRGEGKAAGQKRTAEIEEEEDRRNWFARTFGGEPKEAEVQPPRWQNYDHMAALRKVNPGEWERLILEASKPFYNQGYEWAR